jgi:anaerobic selenocysteine-containing dehydrogenase
MAQVQANSVPRPGGVPSLEETSLVWMAVGTPRGTRPSSGTKTVHAVCTHDCPDSCGVLVTVDTLSGRATKVQGDPAHPVTRGFLCGKVARYLDRVYSPERLLYPMRRRPGVPKGPVPQGHEAEAFERVSWDEALEFIAGKLKSIAAEFGPESILPYSYAGTIGQLGYGSMDRRFFYRLGASQLDRTICSTAGGAALTSVYGVKLGTAPQDFAHAGLIIAWGANIHGNNVHLWPFIEEARRPAAGKTAARLVVIDPYRTRTAALAEEHLAIRPGTDGLLALAMMHVLFRDGCEDREYLRECTQGWEELREFALKGEHSPERAAGVTGIAAAAIEGLAREYGRAGRAGRAPAAIRLNYGIQRSENGGTAARAVCMLPLITGSWKQRGGGLLLSTSGSFPFNSKKLQRPELMQKSALGRAARVVNMVELGWALTELGQRQAAGLSTAPPLRSVSGRDDKFAEGRSEDGPAVKALFVYNCNAAAVAPDSQRALAGLRREDLFTVVHEQFFTDTTDYADVVLPATTFLEHKDLMGAYGHLYAQISERAIAPVGEARSNVRMFAELGRRMGFSEAEFCDGEEELIEQALETDHPWLAGVTKQRLELEGHVALALPKDERGETLPFSTREWFRTPSGRGELTPLPAWIAPHESRGGAANSGVANGGEFPLEFLPRKADNYMNTTFANLPKHQQMERKTAGVLEMHAVDAAARGIVTGDSVSVWNGRGRITLTARVGETVASGVVAARLDWQKLSQDGANVNALTSQRLTDIGGGATFYSTLVEVARIDMGSDPP